MRNDTLKAPSHLRKPTREWWKRTAEDFDLEEYHLKLLTLAAEAWDRCQEARAALAKHGTVYDDRFGQPKARPEVAIERDSRIAFARMLRELALDVEAPEEGARPAPIGGRAHLKAG